MRILVTSDSHGDKITLREIIKRHISSDVFIHLGDGASDMESLRDFIGDKRFIQVKGNCDYESNLPEEILIELGGSKFLCLHGHSCSVKLGTSLLERKAHDLGAHVTLYGHTHNPVTNFNDGRYFFNPGSVKKGQYGLVDILPDSIVCINNTIF